MGALVWEERGWGRFIDEGVFGGLFDQEVGVAVTPDDGAEHTAEVYVSLVRAEGMPEWSRVVTAPIWGLTFMNGEWFTTVGEEVSDDTVTRWTELWQPTDAWTVGTLSGMTRGICNDGTNLWVTGDGIASTTDEGIFYRAPDGTALGHFVTGPNTDGNAGLAFDGTDLWLTEYHGAVCERWSAGGAKLGEFATPDRQVYRDMTVWNGGLLMANRWAARLEHRNFDGSLIRNIDVSDIVAEAIGVEVVGTVLYVSDGTAVYSHPRRLTA